MTEMVHLIRLGYVWHVHVSKNQQYTCKMYAICNEDDKSERTVSYCGTVKKFI